MGFFDRFSSKQPAATPPASAAPTEPAKPAVAGGVLPQLAAARAALEAKDLAGALAIYEAVLAEAADRTDVLVTVSGDLGVNGHVREIIELVAPRYDAQKHGPAAGLNLLQAYLALREAEAAQHVLDVLFALDRPELHDRLLGFSNAIAELIHANANAVFVPPETAKLSMVSVSKPIWFYGLEETAPHLLPAKEGRLRRVAFAQLAVPGLADPLSAAAQPEDEHGRLARAIPLWLAETFFFSAGYSAATAIALQGQSHYALLPAEWSAENVRQLSDTSDGGLDYVVTGALRHQSGDYELGLRLWEVKKFRELKSFAARWNPATADEALRQLHTQLRTYMEWSALPAGQGLAYAPPAAPLAALHALGAALTFFLGEKALLPAAHLPPGSAALLRAARLMPEDVRAQLALVTGLLRMKKLNVAAEPESLEHARAWLTTDAAKAVGVAAVQL
ncbi:MAG: hypothetical protein HY302_16025 [Opitutae bacterium]|nr:hypothetical protein [Opitutae bacterium]